jgi:PAS domain S-box-containing protein
MEKQDINNSKALVLHQKAEKELVARKLSNTMVEEDNLKLIHELQVHQIELEMQNEELLLAKKRSEIAEIAMEKYVDLYDFAPLAYLTLSKDGEILNLNYATARLLEKDRNHLKNNRFGLFVHPESINLYNYTFDQIFNHKSNKMCDIYLISKCGKTIYVHIELIVSEIKDQFMLTMIDISERKRLEIELEKELRHYKELNSYFLNRELIMIDLKTEINELLTKSGCEKEYLI